MATPAKKDPVESAHFRIDEHERQIGSMKETLSPVAIAAMVRGALAEQQLSLEAKLERIIAAQAKDMETDKAVVGKITELCEELKALTVALLSPMTRTSTINLPSGPVTMTVKEQRQ